MDDCHAAVPRGAFRDLSHGAGRALHQGRHQRSWLLPAMRRAVAEGSAENLSPSESTITESGASQAGRRAVDECWPMSELAVRRVKLTIILSRRPRPWAGCLPAPTATTLSPALSSILSAAAALRVWWRFASGGGSSESN